MLIIDLVVEQQANDRQFTDSARKELMASRGMEYTTEQATVAIIAGGVNSDVSGILFKLCLIGDRDVYALINDDDLGARQSPCRRLHATKDCHIDII